MVLRLAVHKAVEQLIIAYPPLVLYARRRSCYLHAFQLALPCSSSNKTGVLSAGCAVAVLTAASTLPGTWTKGFLLVLTGSWLHKLWGKHRLGNLFSALYVLAIAFRHRS